MSTNGRARTSPEPMLPDPTQQRYERLRRAAERVWLTAIPDDDHPGRYLVGSTALEELRKALFEDTETEA